MLTSNQSFNSIPTSRVSPLEGLHVHALDSNLFFNERRPNTFPICMRESSVDVCGIISKQHSRLCEYIFVGMHVLNT